MTQDVRLDKSFQIAAASNSSTASAWPGRNVRVACGVTSPSRPNSGSIAIRKSTPVNACAINVCMKRLLCWRACCSRYSTPIENKFSTTIGGTISVSGRSPNALIPIWTRMTPTTTAIVRFGAYGRSCGPRHEQENIA